MNIKSINMGGDKEFILTPVALSDRDAVITNGVVETMGYITLRSNESVVAQMVAANTIYEVRDFFDLEGKEVTLSANSVLKFEGGMLANGTIIGNGITIEAPLVKIFNDDITLKGDFNCDFYPEWFGAVTYSEETAVDNAAVFNNAVTQIYNMSGAHDLILTGTYLIRDTIFLKPKVSLIGRYGKTSYDAFVGNIEIGSGFLVDFVDNNKYAIDSCLTQLTADRVYSGKKQAIIKHNHLWFDAEAAPEDSYTVTDKIVYNSGNAAVDNIITKRLWVNGWRKSTNIKNIILQPLNNPTTSSEIPFGGIRLISWYSGTIDSVTIQGFAVCLNISESWACCINRLNIKTHYIGVYYGKFSTQCDIRNSDIEQSYVNGVYFDHKTAGLVYRNKANLFLPYDEAGRVEGDEGFTHSITKYIATPESVDETFISTNYPEPNSNVVTLEQGTVSGTGLYEVSNNYCRTPMLRKFKLTVTNEYVIGKLVQYGLDGTFIASYNNEVINNENVIWGKTSLQVNDTNYKWIAVISNKDNTKKITPSEAIIGSFLSGTHLFNSTQLLTVAIMTESYDYDQTKVLLDNIVFQGIDGILINTNNGNASFNFCYIESVSKLGFYTYSGLVRWLNPSFGGNIINPYAAVTFEGAITIEDMTSPRCYPSYTMEDVKSGKTNPRYFVTPQKLYYDKFTVTPKDNNTAINQGVPLYGTVEAGSIAAAKQLVPINNTYYIGVNWMDKHKWNDYSELASGLERDSWIPFNKVLELYDPKVAIFHLVFGQDDYSGGGVLLKDKDFTFIRYDDPATNGAFALSAPMRLQDSKIKIENLQVVQGSLDHIFEVTGKCSIWADLSGQLTPTTTKMVVPISNNNGPVELDFFYNINLHPAYVYDYYFSHLDKCDVKFTLKLSTPSDTQIYTNKIPPTKGVAKGETFIYNGKTLIWNGSSWDPQLISNYGLYVALGAEYNNTVADIIKTAPWGEEVTHKVSHWYYNGLGDITDAQMATIYLYKDLLTSNQLDMILGTARISARTTVPIEYGPILKDIIKSKQTQFFRGNYIEVVRWGLYDAQYGNTFITLDTTNTSCMPVMHTDMYLAFGENGQLKCVYPINVSNTTSLSRVFDNSPKLVDARLYGLKADVSFSKSPNIRKECLMYIISNANPTTAITITLHATAHANIGFADENSEINTLLNEKNAALSANGGSISVVSA